MRTKIAVKLTNGIEKKIECEYFIESIFVNIDNQNQMTSIDKETYDILCSRMLTLFSKCEVDNIYSFGFKITSIDIEFLQAKDLELDWRSCSDELYNNLKNIVLNRIDNTKISDEKSIVSDEELIGLIKQYKDRLKTNLIHQDYPYTHNIKNILELIQNRKYDEAKKELQKLQASDNSYSSIYNICIGQFLINTKLSLDESKVEDEFRTNIEKFKESPKWVSSFYFEYIKYFEDRRNARKALSLINEYTEKYSLELLTDDQNIYLLYLKGRSYYQSGDYLKALNSLGKAMLLSRSNIDYLSTRLYNTITNIFNDNLFFIHAEYTANKSLSLRQEEESSNLHESYSCLAGVYFKHCQFDKAVNTFLKAKEIVESNCLELSSTEHNRLNNYIAKSFIMLKDFKKAEEYLTEANSYDDRRGFSFYLNILRFYVEKKYDIIIKEFSKKQKLMEEYDKFVLGWIHFFVAEAYYHIKKYDEADKFFNQSVNHFMDDRYILEASYLYHISDIPKFASFTKNEHHDSDLKDRVKEKVISYIDMHCDIVETYGYLFEGYEIKEEKDYYLIELNFIDMDYHNKETKDMLKKSICLF
jgi:tetratricopeptide (TPR) repeat protein